MKNVNHTLRVLGLTTMIVLALPARASDQVGQTEPEAWTPAKWRVTIEEMPAGNPARGSKLHSNLMCASCHGDKGIAPTGNWPNVAGQKADYTYKMLLDYQSGLRAEDQRSKLMTTVVAMMDTQDMADVAEFYATLEAEKSAEQPAPAPENETQTEAQTKVAEQLVRRGDPKRLITPCASCHGVKGQGGKEAASALAGQNRKAFIRTMYLYKSGQRHNDVNQVMSQVARKLSDEEIRLLAAYYHMQ